MFIVADTLDTIILEMLYPILGKEVCWGILTGDVRKTSEKIKFAEEERFFTKKIRMD